MKRVVAALFLAILADKASATGADFSECHAIIGRDERLLCYDMLSGYKKAASSPGASGKQWLMSEEESALDGRKDVWLSVGSGNTQPNQIGQSERAHFWVRCMNNSTNSFIAFNDYTTDNQSVRYRLDDTPVKKIWMQTMNGGDGIGLWSGKATIPFVKSLFGKMELVVAYESYSNSALEFTFDISGLRDRIEPLASACGWRP